MKRYRIYQICCVVALCLLAVAGGGVPAQAAPLDITDVGRRFGQAVREGGKQVTFQTSAEYTLDQLLNQLSKAAEKLGMLFTEEYTYQRQETDGLATYTFTFTGDSLLKVHRLKNKDAACKAALKALKNCDYSTKFYSDRSFYPVFLLMLQQHPEYNYNTMVWKNSNGTYGYHRSSELTKADQNRRMRAADDKAGRIVRNILTPAMTETQKFQAIHDYLMKHCAYNYGLKKISGYEESLTAYGALVEGMSVCQGYTAAFNLLAQKAGLDSIAVCGLVSTGDHACNYVACDGRYRYVDCTWDKTLQTGSSIRYDYFLVTKQLMGQNHTWNTKKFRSEYVSYCKYLR